MVCRLVLFVSLLTIVCVGGVCAKWDPWSATETRLLVDGSLKEGTDENGIRYVIAVGTEEKPEIVQAEQIKEALLAGKEIRLEWVEIKEHIEFHDVIEQAVYFSDATFSGGADFSFATFNGGADFSFATFSGGADFSFAEFSGEAGFMYATFSGGADFSDATFSGKADFMQAANFMSATFNGKAYFRNATFNGEAYFNNATFNGEAYFSFAEFKEKANFSTCRFKELSRFLGCLYSTNTKMNFSEVAGFSQMQFEWEYALRGDVTDYYKIIYKTKDNRDKQRRGLKGRLEYNETFYIALIKNYQDIGWLDEADDCYYTYRVEKRERVNEDNKPLNSWYKRAVEYIVLDFPFGYGVKPFKFLRSFLILWIPFSLYYSFFLRHREKDTTPWVTAPYTIHEAGAFMWAYLYSLNLITPGVNLVPQKDSFIGGSDLKKSPYEFSHDSRGVKYAQRFQQLLGWYLLALFLVMFGKIWIR